jgi:uncharacterized membrane protein YhaH (DUF805 family)
MRLLSFSGRSDRFEWWVTTLLSDLAAQLSLVFGLIALQSGGSFRYLLSGGLFLCIVIALWLSIAVSARRFRDRGRSPWLLLAGLVPLVGWLWYLIECGFLPAPDARGPRKLVRRTVTAAGSDAPDERPP